MNYYKYNKTEVTEIDMQQSIKMLWYYPTCLKVHKNLIYNMDLEN